MGGKPSVPLSPQEEETAKERFHRFFKIVPVNELIIGRKYHVWHKYKEEREGNYKEPLLYQGVFVPPHVPGHALETPLLSFRDRYRETISDRWGATSFPETRNYRREDVVIYQSRDTLAAEQAARGLAAVLPEDNVHLIKSFLIGADRENRYEKRGLKDFQMKENYFQENFFLKIKENQSSYAEEEADKLYKKLYNGGSDWITIREEVEKISKLYADRVSVDIGRAAKLFIQKNPLNKDGSKRTVSYYYALIYKGTPFPANTSGISPSFF